MDVPREHLSESETATGTHFLTTAWDKLLCYWDLKTGQNVWRNRLKVSFLSKLYFIILLTLIKQMSIMN